ncbi:MAG: membrane protein insertion efficiency factor YidD [Nanoarchaeota archaeon]
MKQNSSEGNNLLVLVSNLFITKVYRSHIKPYLKKKRNTLCGFYPDCSEYGLLALKKYGFVIGWIRTVNRILRCSGYKHKNSCIDFP